MKEQETKDKFLQLRADGVSYDKISKMIKVSKPTLIGWGKEYKKKIKDLKAIRYEQILEKYKATREERLERIVKELQTVWKKYDALDYKNLSKKDLLNIIIRLEKVVREETDPVLNPKTSPEEDEPEEFKLHLSRTIFHRDPETNELVYEEDPNSRRTVIIPRLDR